jgi:DNA gyrase subunit A
LGVKEVTDELEELAGKIKDYLDILASRERILAIISDELAEVREKFAVPAAPRSPTGPATWKTRT